MRTFLRDPLISIANSRWAVLISLVMTILVFATLFCCFEQGNPRLQGHPKFGFWVACYWAIVTMTTVGYGDVSPTTTQGQFLACVLGIWSVFFLLPVAIANVYNGVVKDKDKWTDAEQEQVKADLVAIRQDIEALRG